MRQRLYMNIILRWFWGPRYFQPHLTRPGTTPPVHGEGRAQPGQPANAADHSRRIASIGWSSVPGRRQTFRSRSMRTCYATPPVISWQAMGTIRDQSKTTSGTRISSTPCAIPSSRRRVSKIFGATRSRYANFVGLGSISANIGLFSIRRPCTLPHNIRYSGEVDVIRHHDSSGASAGYV